MVDAQMAGTIVEHLERQKEEMLTYLAQLVKTETPSHDPDSQEAIFFLITKSLEDLGYKVNRVPGDKTGGYLFAYPMQRVKHQEIQCMIGHCDTVWSMGTLASMPLKRENTQLSGPGVYDMKAGLTQIIYALKTIVDLELTPPFTPVAVINSDEEIGSRESTTIIRRLAKIAKRAFVLEPPLGLDGKLKTARKGLGRFTLTVRGTAAHAGLDPQKGASAIVELSHQIQQLFAMNDLEKGISVNVGMIEGGVSANVVAPESKAVIDVRVLTQEDGDEISRKIHGLTPHLSNTALHIEGAIGRPPMEQTPRNQGLWEMAKAKGKLLGLKLEQGTAGGGSDGNTTSLYTATLDGLGTTGDGAHASHEFIFADKLVERTALLTLLLLDSSSQVQTTSDNL